MRTLCYIAFTLLRSLPFLSAELSIQCNKAQYAWPVDAAKFCCDKCPPGKRMVRRTEDSCSRECVSCTGDRYSDSYNVEMSCNICRNCNKSNMEYKLRCNATHNAVCRCIMGYRCKDQGCTQCIPLPDTTTLPSFTTTEAAVTRWLPKPITDTVWFLVIIALLCIGIAFAVVTKIKPFLRWIRSCLGYFLVEKAPPESCEDEEVSKPVQEVCGKCDQPIDV